MGAGLGDVDATNRLRLISALLQLIRDFPERIGEPSLELGDRHVIDPGGTFLRGDLLEGRPQIAVREYLVKESKPFASFYSLFKSRQHTHVPGRRFDPAPARGDLSDLLSRWHYRRFVLRRSGHVASIFLESFAPPELPGFNATMTPLTPAGRVLRITGIVNARLVPAGLTA